MPTRFDHHALARARTELGLTQEQAAAQLGVDVRTYRRYESGAVNARGFSVRHASRRRFLERVAAAFGGDPDDLLLHDPPPPTSARHGHALPPARHFLGRDASLTRLRAWRDAATPTDRVLALVAPGGTGKTSLAAELVRDGPHPTFVWSFYEDPRVDAWLAAAAAFGGDPGTGPLTDRVHAALTRDTPCLWVLDGLEVLQAQGDGRARGELEDPTLRRLLRRLADGPSGTRALITSRLAPCDLDPWEGRGVRVEHLEHLEPEHGAELLRRWGVQGSPAILQDLSRRVGGHALSLAMAGSYGAEYLDGDAAALPTIDPADAAPDDPLARRLAALLDAYARALPPGEVDLLSRVALFPGGASHSACAAIAAAGPEVAGAMHGWTSLELRRRLRRLQTLGLLAPGGHGVVTHPFVGRFFRRRVEATAPAVHDVALTDVTRWLDAHPDAGPERDDVKDRLEAVVVHALGARRPELALATYRRGLGGFHRLGLLAGDMARGLRVVRAFADGGDPADVPLELLPLVYDWGLYSAALGDLDHALRCYDDYDARSTDPADRTTAARALAYTHWLAGRLDVAAEHAHRALARARQTGLLAHEIRAHALLARIDLDRGDLVGALAGVDTAQRLEDGPLQARRALWAAEVWLGAGRPTAALQQAERVIETCNAWGWEGHVAHAECVAAEADGDRARVSRARGWAERSGEVEMRLRVARVEALLSAGDERRALGERGLELARSCGFGGAERALRALLEGTAGGPDATRNG